MRQYKAHFVCFLRHSSDSITASARFGSTNGAVFFEAQIVKKKIQSSPAYVSAGSR
jgi:hypothetical protein